MNAEPASTAEQARGRRAGDAGEPAPAPAGRSGHRGPGGGAGWPRRLWRALTRPRGNRLWDAVVRGSGLLALLGIGLVELVPTTAPLVGFSVLTIWITGPLSPLFPTGYEPVLMVMGRVYPPLLVAAVAMGVQAYVEVVNYHLHRRLLELDAVQPFRESSAVQKLKGYFERQPFLTVWFCAWSPVPYWVVRILAPLSAYPIGRYMAATVLGRFPKIWLFAALGVFWQAPSDTLLLALAGGTMLIGAAVWAYRRWRGGGSAEAPTSWQSAGDAEPGTAATGREE